MPDMPPWIPAAALWLQLPFFTFLGAFALYLMNRLQGKQPFSFFRALNIDVGTGAGPLVILSDMVISSILGATLVIALTAPATVPQAVVAGLGMTGILSAHTKP
jgi:hypothetical protein